MDRNENDGEILSELEKLQKVINISADRLMGFRTQCEINAELTQQEIRTLEGKLIKLFAKQIVQREQLSRNKKTPQFGILTDRAVLERWLQVVDLHPKSIRAICDRVRSLEALLERPEPELKRLLAKGAVTTGGDNEYEEEEGLEEEARRLARALRNLRRFTESVRSGDHVAEPLDLKLYWDNKSISRCTPSVSSASFGNYQNQQMRYSPKIPRNEILKDNVYDHDHEDGSLFRNVRGGSPLVDNNILTKSKSHECHFNPSDINGDSLSIGKRSRLPTEPGPNTTFSMLSSPIHSPPFTIQEPNDNTLLPPRSPRTPTFPRGVGIMAHTINHRFTKTFKMMSTCNYCEKQLVFGTGSKCRECQYICHRECEPKVPPACQLPLELLQEFKQASHSPLTSRSAAVSPHHSVGRQPLKRVFGGGQPNFNSTAFPHGADSSSASSCNSSAPSSPALVVPPPPPLLPGRPPSTQNSPQQFIYPDIITPASTITFSENNVAETTVTIASKNDDIRHINGMTDTRDSDRTVVSVSGSASTDSDRTPKRVDSQDSQVSDCEQDRGWPRQNSLSMREWDIPYEEVRLFEYIGQGRFGKVRRGNWHGDVAVKLLDMNYIEDAKRLDAFKNEVATFRKTRHDNLVLFIGACVKLEKFAIITSLCKGMTLYRHIHVLKERFGLNKNINIAQQISQGMGYLHAKGIVHKDLKSKNIFLECGSKVVITDFGLFGVTKLSYGHRQDRDGLIIPPGWLCYLSSEVMKCLRSSYQRDEELPFSKASDVYAFGTVWYELLCGDWPFRGQPPEAIIWQVGKGMKQSLANLQASRDVKVFENTVFFFKITDLKSLDLGISIQSRIKVVPHIWSVILRDILMVCWSYRPTDRPDFASLLKTLEKLPKKRLARSPSHPIHLSKSAESVF